MKRIINRCLILLFVICGMLVMASCELYNVQIHSIEEYKKAMENGPIGFSNTGLDNGEEFLPSITFLDDYEYTLGEFHYIDISSIGCKSDPDEIVFLRLTYEKNTYLLAKSFTLANIPKYENNEYYYNDYIFYQNANFRTPERFPHWFTMVCYNDELNTLLFMGFYDKSPYVENEISANWKSFIDETYGKYYNFNN